MLDGCLPLVSSQILEASFLNVQEIAYSEGKAEGVLLILPTFMYVHSQPGLPTISLLLTTAGKNSKFVLAAAGSQVQVR